MALAAAPVPVYITKISLVWRTQPTNTPKSFFVVFMGTNQGVYPIRLIGGPTNSYLLIRTNWVERKMNHYFVVRDNFGYQVSKEVRHPKYPDNTLEFTWSNRVPTTIESSTSFFSNWAFQALISSTNRMTFSFPAKNTFWRLWQPPGTKPDRLQIRKYNPLNEP